MDFYAEFCLKLPIFVICDMLGLPREDAAILKRAADANTRLAGGSLETEEVRCELHREQVALQLYLQPHIDRYRKKAEDNLISKLIHTAPEDGQPLSDREVLSLLSLLNVGGNETTTNGLGNMFQICFSNGQLQDRLRGDISEIPKFVEEALRLESPVRAMPRFVTRDTEIGGVSIPAGSFVLVSFAAANRDLAKFDCPENLNTNRSGLRNHMAFGMGAHYCLGAMLARMELRVALEHVLRRMGEVRIETTGKPISHEHKMLIRALTSLPISFTRLH